MVYMNGDKQELETKSSWKKLLEQTRIPDLQIKDLRKFLNSVLVNDFVV